MSNKDDIATIQPFIELGLCLVICLAAAVFGIMFEPGEWYDNLSKPSWTPPDHVFSWIWSALYVMMGSAAWIVWRQRGSTGITLPLAVFTLQLFLNAVWAYLFFGLHRLGVALIDAGLLLVVIAVVVTVFWKISVLAGLFLVPYFLWMFFAVFLKSNPNTNVVMAGFTDNVGTEAYNLPLSKRRVESVANYLEQQDVGMALMPNRPIRIISSSPSFDRFGAFDAYALFLIHNPFSIR